MEIAQLDPAADAALPIALRGEPSDFPMLLKRNSIFTYSPPECEVQITGSNANPRSD